MELSRSRVQIQKGCGALLLMLCVIPIRCPVCKYPGRFTKVKEFHVFKDPEFWQHFQDAVQSKYWKCHFPKDILLQSFERDAMLYKADEVHYFRKRRYAALEWMQNDTEWIVVILGACKEIADGHKGIYVSELEKCHMMEPLLDFAEHLNCFYTVALEMESRGQTVRPLSQGCSELHDIDKLDPVMMVGYSERFEDNQTTSIWGSCVERHTVVNPHHQAHCLWNKDGSCCGACGRYCRDVMEKAIREMVCDKVSRHLQKNLNGEASRDMWNVDMRYFKGLPPTWLRKVSQLLKEMKHG